MATSALASSAARSARPGRKPAKVTGSPAARPGGPGAIAAGPRPPRPAGPACPRRAGWPAWSASAAASSPPRAAAVHQQDLSLAHVSGPDLPEPFNPRAERGQVHAERDADQVRRADPAELGRRPAGRADDPVLGPGGAPIQPVGHAAQRPSGSAQQGVTLSCETMTAGTPCSRPTPVQRSVVRSDTSRASGRSGQQPGQPPPAPQHPVAAGERHPRRAQRDDPALRGQLVAVPLARDDQHRLVPGGQLAAPSSASEVRSPPECGATKLASRTILISRPGRACAPEHGGVMPGQFLGQRGQPRRGPCSARPRRTRRTPGRRRAGPPRRWSRRIRRRHQESGHPVLHQVERSADGRGDHGARSPPPPAGVCRTSRRDRCARTRPGWRRWPRVPALALAQENAPGTAGAARPRPARRPR